MLLPSVRDATCEDVANYECTQSPTLGCASRFWEDTLSVVVSITAIVQTLARPTVATVVKAILLGPKLCWSVIQGTRTHVIITLRVSPEVVETCLQAKKILKWKCAG